MFWFNFASWAALPFTLFFLFGMQPFLNFLGTWQATQQAKKGKPANLDHVEGTWMRTKR